jgi:segregation and condensation protein A
MGYEVQTPVFEGPFDLLLHLILREEVDLFEVSLALIVDRYLEQVARLERLDLDVATEFLLIAATLVDLKARRLLPGREDDPDLDDELSRWDERDYLIARLLECKTFKDASQHLQHAMQEAQRSLPRTAGPEEPFASLAPDPLERVKLADFLAAAQRGLTPKVEPEVRTDHVAPVRASVRDAIEAVLALLPAAGAVDFRDLVVGTNERLEIVVRFLACLELYKQGLVDLEQVSTFGELRVRPLAMGERAGIDLVIYADWDDEPVPAIVADDDADGHDEVEAEAPETEAVRA